MLELMLETDYHCLWDPTNSEFKNRTTRNAVWQKMSELLKIEGHNVESGMHNGKLMNRVKLDDTTA